MRVGLDFRPPLYSTAGIARAAAELAVALRGEPEVELVLYGDAWRRPEDPARVADLVERSGGRLVRARVPARITAALGRVGVGIEARTGPLDVFHCTDLVYPPLARTPRVITLHDVVFEIDATVHGPEFHREVPARVRRALAGAAAVLVSSDETRRQVTARGLADPSRVRVAPLGGDHVLRLDAGSDHDRVARQAAARTRLDRAGVGPRYLLYVATLEPRKNHATLLDAHALLDPGDRPDLVLVGRRGWLCDDLVARIASAPGVALLEDVPDVWLPGLIRGAELVVYPSRYEGFGLPVLEAMTLGAPVLTTRAGALPEVGGEAVAYADPDDAEGMAVAVAALLADPAARADLGRAGAARARGFTWARTAAAAVATYREVIGGGA